MTLTIINLSVNSSGMRSANLSIANLQSVQVVQTSVGMTFIANFAPAIAKAWVSGGGIQIVGNLCAHDRILQQCSVGAGFHDDQRSITVGIGAAARTDRDEQTPASDDLRRARLFLFTPPFSGSVRRYRTPARGQAASERFIKTSGPP